MTSPFTIDQLATMVSRSARFLRQIQEENAKPDNRKSLKRIFSPSEAAEMVGRNRTTLLRAESAVGITDPLKADTNGRRLGYTLDQVNAFRKHFDTSPQRSPETDPALIVGVSSFKGGSGKTTTTVNLAHYLALKGYRVLVVDADSQATSTAMFGYVPDLDLTEKDTLSPFLHGDVDFTDLSYAIRPTYFPGIDLIPACLEMYNFEFSGFVQLSRLESEEARVDHLHQLQRGLQAQADRYDFILLDAPPSMGLLTINVLLASDVLIVPSPARMFDFASTVQYMNMVHTYLERLAPEKVFRRIAVLATMYDKRYTAQRQFLDLMRRYFETAMLEHVFSNSSAFINDAGEFQTPYEKQKPNREVLMMMDAVFGEIETMLIKEWPSKEAELARRAVIVNGKKPTS